MTGTVLRLTPVYRYETVRYKDCCILEDLINGSPTVNTVHMNLVRTGFKTKTNYNFHLRIDIYQCCGSGMFISDPRSWI